MLAVAACSDNSIEIKDYSLSTVSVDLEADIKSKKINFLSVCGYSCSTPGIGFVDRIFCYDQVGKPKVIDGTDDVILDRDQARLKINAAQYARAYNLQLIDYLNSEEKRSCLREEEWTAAWLATNKIIVNMDNIYSSISAPYTRNDDFLVSLRNDHNPEDLMSTICTSFRSHGVRSTFGVKVTHSGMVRDKWESRDLYQFSCTDGNYEKL